MRTFSKQLIQSLFAAFTLFLVLNNGCQNQTSKLAPAGDSETRSATEKAEKSETDRRVSNKASDEKNVLNAADHDKTDSPSGSASDGDYSWWRGPNRNDIFSSGSAPMEWSETKNVRWKTPIPGSGHGTPILVGNRIFLPTSDLQQDGQVTISIVSLDRKTGQIRETKPLRTGQKQKRLHADNSPASATIASDGERLFYPYSLNGRLYLDCISLDLTPVWSEDLGAYESWFGYSGSPLLYKDTIIMSGAEEKGACCLGAYDCATGKRRWLTKQVASNPTYASPILIHSSGRDQVVVNGPKTSAGYDPQNGQVLWSVEGPTDCCPSSGAWDDTTVYLSGGWPTRQLIAVETGSANPIIRWKHAGHPLPPYVASILYKDGLLYCLADEGEFYCLDAATGKVVWKDNTRQKFYSSPVMLGDKIYLFGRSGGGWIYQAGRTMKKLAENRLDAQFWATPVMADGGIYIRSLDSLYFIAE